MARGAYERTPEQRAAAAENMRRIRVSNGWPASAHAPAKQAARVSPEERAQRWPEWRAANPERAAEANRNAGLASTAHAYLCTCGRVIHGPSAFRHAKKNGHAVARIDTNTKEIA